MSIAHQKKEKYENGNNYLGTNDSEGTSARTRAFTFEQVMLRRRNKKHAEDVKEEISVSKSLPEKGDSGNAHGRREPDGGDDLRKDPKDTTGGIRAKEVAPNKKTSPSKYKDRVRDDLKASTKDKTKVKSSHDKISLNKEVNNEKQSRHRNRADERSKPESEKESGKRLFKDTQVKDNHERKYGNYVRADKKKKFTVNNEKPRRPIDIFTAKKYDPGHRQEREPLDRRKVRRYEEQSSKRRRSRSREFDRSRGRSPSMSPKGYKRSFHGRDHGESSNRFVKYRTGGQHSNAGKYRASGSGRHESARYQQRESGLGGYSPRKRKTEAAPVKISSPAVPSPEKKEATWDLPPSGVNRTSSTSVPRNLQSSAQSTYDQPSSISETAIPVKPQGTSSSAAPTVSFASIDSVHLTQATRSLRRLYMENLPASATDKSILSYLNDLLLTAGANHIPGSQPCISCIINKEKGQAVVEFLTPEDATAALSFDGKSLSGSAIKFRRPKDFVDTIATTGVQEKPVAALNEITDIVKDSPQKIFIGGVSEFLSSDKLLEIVSAFGLVKAYHFEFNPELNQSCAFLEYTDQSITQRACAGLNGLKLGGSVITVVRALPDTHLGEENPGTPSYRVPEHARPLLERPTQVLKLKNLLDQESFSRLSELDLEEILEDVRLECARFGTVKSMNVVRYAPADRAGVDIEQDQVNVSVNMKLEGDGQQPPPDHNEKSEDITEEVPEEPAEATGASHRSPQTAADAKLEDLPAEPETRGEELDGGHGADNGAAMEEEVREDSPKLDPPAEEKSNQTSESSNHQADDRELEPGCVLVEFLRKEAACAAAHCLNGRLYDGRAVAASYAPHDIYLARFPK